MTDKIFKKGYKLSSDKIKMTPEIQKSIDDTIEKQKELRKGYDLFTLLIIPDVVVNEVELCGICNENIKIIHGKLCEHKDCVRYR